MNNGDRANVDEGRLGTTGITQLSDKEDCGQWGSGKCLIGKTVNNGDQANVGWQLLRT